MEEEQKNTGQSQSIGVAALITAIITFVLAVIPWHQEVILRVDYYLQV
jgi:hypothetical protein